jgi:hypothetical protein
MGELPLMVGSTCDSPGRFSLAAFPDWRQVLSSFNAASEEMEASALRRKTNVGCVLLRRGSSSFCYHELIHQLPKQSEQDLKISFMWLIGNQAHLPQLALRGNRIHS